MVVSAERRPPNGDAGSSSSPGKDTMVTRLLAIDLEISNLAFRTIGPVPPLRGCQGFLSHDQVWPSAHADHPHAKHFFEIGTYVYRQDYKVLGLWQGGFMGASVGAWIWEAISFLAGLRPYGPTIDAKLRLVLRCKKNSWVGCKTESGSAMQNRLWSNHLSRERG